MVSFLFFQIPVIRFPFFLLFLSELPVGPTTLGGGEWGLQAKTKVEGGWRKAGRALPASLLPPRSIQVAWLGHRQEVPISPPKKNQTKLLCLRDPSVRSEYLVYKRHCRLEHCSPFKISGFAIHFNFIIHLLFF